MKFTAPATGTYYLVARSYQDENQAPTAGGYTLTANFGPAQNPLDAIDWGTKLASNFVDVFFVPAGQSAGGVQSSGWSGGEINSVMSILSAISDVANLVFNRVFSTAGAEFRLVKSSDASLDFAGSMGPPGSGDAGAGIFNTNSSLWKAGLAKGQAGYALVMHEILHGLGFAHPHDNGGQSEVLQGVTAPNDVFGIHGLNQGVYTNLSYNDGFPAESTVTLTTGQQAGPAALDIALLQQKYGANSTFQPGNNVYTLPEANMPGIFFTTIWDTGGTDSIVYSGGNNATIDLRSATLALEEGGGGYVSRAGSARGGFTIAAGAVVENATGGSGNDRLTGNDAANLLNGNGGADTLIGGQGADTLIGGAGADFLDGGDGEDTASYGASLSGVSVNLVSGAATGGDANGDTLSGIEHVSGSAFADLLFGDSANNRLSGGAGQDTLEGGAGADELFGGGDNDVLSGGDGNDTLAGGDGDDSMDGGSGADELFGGAGADWMIGGADNDLMTGNAGNDTLDGGDGDDTVYGGDNNDIVMGGAGNDNISGTRGFDTVYGGLGNDTAVGGNDDDEVHGGDGDDLVAGTLGNDTVYGEAGADTVLGGDGNDLLFGGTENDELYGGLNNDTLWGGTGNDLLAGADHDDLLNGEDGLDTLFGGNGNDTLNGGGGDDQLFGNAGNDQLSGGAGADTLNGGGGDDLLNGGDGNDVLLGDVGNDTLAGGLGDDTMNGGGGDDRFDYAMGDGSDVINGFAAGAASEDVVFLSGFGAAFDEFADILANASDDGTNTTIDLGGGASITLNGVLAADLHQDDFLFG
jgi:serralysin